MICYRGQTYCPFSECTNFSTCDRALTDEVEADAVRWWGSENAPISVYGEKPECFDERQKGEI